MHDKLDDSLILTDSLVTPPNGVRFAKSSDCHDLLEIYKPYILESAISFETELPSIGDFKSRFTEITEKFPWLIYENENQILGYAYGSTHRSRCAYDWSCEVSVYIRQGHHRKGIGSRLYTTLFEILKKQGFYNLFAGITQPNEASNKLHTKLGFTKVGVYKNIGYKFNEWHDVAWYQLEINSGGRPKTPHNIGQLTKAPY